MASYALGMHPSLFIITLQVIAVIQSDLISGGGLVV